MAKHLNSANADAVAPALSALPELIRPAQLAAALGIHKITLWRWAKAGIAPKRITVGATVMFAREDVLAWLSDNKHQGA